MVNESSLLSQLRESLDIVGAAAATAFGVWGVFAVRKVMQLRQINYTLENGPGMWLFSKDLHKKYLDAIRRVEQTSVLEKEFKNLTKQLKSEEKWKFEPSGYRVDKALQAAQELLHRRRLRKLRDYEEKIEEEINLNTIALKAVFDIDNSDSDIEKQKKVLNTIKEKLKHEVSDQGARERFLVTLLNSKITAITEEKKKVLDEEKAARKIQGDLTEINKKKLELEAAEQNLRDYFRSDKDKLWFFSDMISADQKELKKYREMLVGGRFSKALMWMWNRGMYLVLIGRINATLKKLESRIKYLGFLREVTEEVKTAKRDAAERIREIQ